MFKNVIIYRITSTLPNFIALEPGLQAMTFTVCGPTQEKSFGWVPPRGEDHAALAESIGGQWLLSFMTETKAVPASVLARGVKERAAQIEATTGRKPGRKESRDLKEEVKQALLPMAFSKLRATLVWIDPEAKLLVIDAASSTCADEVATSLVKSVDGLALAPLYTQQSPSTAMALWLQTQEPPTDFTVDRECELKATDETRAVVKYGHHPLDIEEVKQHIATGKVPTKLAMTWDDRVSFVLTDALTLKKLTFLDVVFEGDKPEDSGFDADAAIATGELVRLVPALLEALGGEQAPLGGT